MPFMVKMMKAIKDDVELGAHGVGETVQENM
jgi:hypothetical protein